MIDKNGIYEPIPITYSLIGETIGLSRKGSIVLLTRKVALLVEELTGLSTRKISKGLIISKVQCKNYKWVSFIISLCLISLGRASDLRLYMLEVVK